MSSLRFIIKFSVIGFAIAIFILWLRTHPDYYVHTAPPGSYANAVKKTAPAVVSITIRQRNTLSISPFYQHFSQQGKQPPIEAMSGSGVIVSENGYILTNYHVIEQADSVHVLLEDGREFPAKIIGIDPETDLAVLHINATDLNAISFGDDRFIEVGDIVLAIGNPFNIGKTVTMGIVSATGRDRLGINIFENFIQTDATINPGNSGGALINTHGDLVGINTAIFTQDGGSQGIGFAIPVSMAKNILTQILKNGRVVRGWIGVEGIDLPSASKRRYNISHGVYIANVFQGGPAQLAGIRKGDIITHIDHKPIANIKDILNDVTARMPGDSMHIQGLRNQSIYNATLIVVQRPIMNRSR